MSVRVRAVQSLREHALGNSRRHVAQLQQTIQPQVADTFEVGGLEARARQHLGEQRHRRRLRAFERRQANERRVGSNLGVQLSPKPAKSLVQRQRIELAATFVEQITGDGGQTRPVGGIVRGTGTNDNEHGKERNLAMYGRPCVDTIRQAPPSNLRERPGGFRARTWQTRTIGWHQDTSTGREPSSASSLRPRGTTLNATRAGPSQVLAARRRSSG